MHNFWRVQSWFSAKGASTRSPLPWIHLTPLQVGVLLTGVWAILGAIATIQDRPVQLLERNLQLVFFQLRGPVAPPEEMIILAIDRESLARGSKSIRRRNRNWHLCRLYRGNVRSMLRLSIA
uniref:Uncharacterized protein n=1 Tax=Desertifilum tharense IPPAS B-1220 TaxID=1781255 RepID=A0ACD5H095_9CYAN